MAAQKFTRRQALKTILAASGGLAGAGFLPVKWLKPIVSAGVAPVHAATSSAKYLYGREDQHGYTDGNSTVTVSGIEAFVSSKTKTYNQEGSGSNSTTAQLNTSPSDGIPGVWVSLYYKNGITGEEVTPKIPKKPLQKVQTDSTGTATFSDQVFNLTGLNSSNPKTYDFYLTLTAPGCSYSPVDIHITND